MIRIPKAKQADFLQEIKNILKNKAGVDFHRLEKLRGRAVSFSYVIPQMRMYIRQMTQALTCAEASLESILTLTPELTYELSSWLETAQFLSNERDFHAFQETDIVLKNVIPDYEYMSDASDFAIGIYDCNSKQTMRRQFSIPEGEKINIAGKEALAVQMVLANIPEYPKPNRVRLHVDNQGRGGEKTEREGVSQ